MHNELISCPYNVNQKLHNFQGIVQLCHFLHCQVVLRCQPGSAVMNLDLRCHIDSYISVADHTLAVLDSPDSPPEVGHKIGNIAGAAYNALPIAAASIQARTKNNGVTKVSWPSLSSILWCHRQPMPKSPSSNLHRRQPHQHQQS